MSSTNSPCAACKCRRQKCTQECVFAPYFPPDNPQKFTNVHKVFGSSNVSKLLNELNASQREDAVNSLAYEAEYRLRDPVYGCVGLISILQHRLKQVQLDLETAKKELATYIGPSAMLPILNHPGLHSNFGPAGFQMMAPYNQQPMMGIPQHQQQQQLQFLESQQEMMRSYEEHQQQQNEVMRFNGGFDESGAGPSVTATGFNQMDGGASMQQQPPASLALGASYEAIPYHQIQVPQEEPHTQTHIINLQPQDLLLQQQQRAKSEEVRSVGLSC